MAAAATPRRSRSRRDTPATSSIGAASSCAAASSCSVSFTTASASSIDSLGGESRRELGRRGPPVAPLPDERRRVVQRMHALPRRVVDAQLAVDRLNVDRFDPVGIRFADMGGPSIATRHRTTAPSSPTKPRRARKPKAYTKLFPSRPARLQLSRQARPLCVRLRRSQERIDRPTEDRPDGMSTSGQDIRHRARRFPNFRSQALIFSDRPASLDKYWLPHYRQGGT